MDQHVMQIHNTLLNQQLYKMKYVVEQHKIVKNIK